MANIMEILAEEVLGYHARLSTRGVGSPEILSALAGCEGAPVQECVEGGGVPSGPPRWHLGFETWETAEMTEAYLQRAAPDRVPERVGRLDYAGSQGTHVRPETVQRGLSRSGLSLDWYRGYNASWWEPAEYFDAFQALDPASLLPCNSSDYPDVLGDYPRLFPGDVGGFRPAADGGAARLACHDAGGRWWLSPACRQTPQRCVPYVDYAAWGGQATLQQATHWNMPIAMAQCVTREACEALVKKHNVMTYWWGPDITYITQDLRSVSFPAYSHAEWAQGLKVSTGQFVPLQNWAARGLSKVASKAHAVASRVTMTREDMDRLLLEVATSNLSHYQAACSWLRKSPERWSSWVPDPRACLVGQGLVDGEGQVVVQPEKALSCGWCSPGTFSAFVNGSTFRTCSECLPGTSQKDPGQEECRTCSAGSFADLRGAETCQTCPMGTFTEREGSHSCTPCSVVAEGATTQQPGANTPDACRPCRGGTYLEGTECLPCQIGRFAAGTGNTACEACPPGMSTDYIASLDCRFNSAYLVASAFVFLGLALASILTMVTCRRQFIVNDISLKDGKAVLVTSAEHWLVKYSGFLSATLMGSGNLDGPCKVRPISSNTLEFQSDLFRKLAAKGVSCGTLVLDFPSELIYTGRARVTVAFLVPVLLAASAVTALLTPMQPAHLTFVCVSSGACGLLTVPLRRWRFLNTFRRTPINLAVRMFRQELAGRREEDGIYTLLTNGRPSLNVPMGPQRAVNAGQIWRLWEFFSSFIQDRPMFYVVQEIIKPITQEHKLSYAEVAGCNELEWFVSHSWGDPFAEFALTLRCHAMDVAGQLWPDVRYWACSLSINQWDVRSEIGEHWSKTSFFMALRSPMCQGTVLVIQETAAPLTRSWCLFEVLQTFLLKEERPGDFKGLSLASHAGVLNSGTCPVDLVLTIAKKMSHLYFEEATATSPADKKLIDEAVLKFVGSFEAMNNFVRSQIQEAVVAGKHQLEANIVKVVSNLSAQAPHTNDLRTASMRVRDMIAEEAAGRRWTTGRERDEDVEMFRIDETNPDMEESWFEDEEEEGPVAPPALGERRIILVEGAGEDSESLFRLEEGTMVPQNQI